ncbi:MAG: pentapeptide repeat-containing protein [Capsulimonas sp.]|uniref:pentapeptide repeat-containing protein n=1 Tax=Capsulimonas sp. TaxID=2494211 RepID=UPI003265227D
MRKQKNSYSDRWRTIAGASQSIQVLEALKKRRPLASLGFLEKYDGRWDLRGFVFPSATVTPVSEFDHHVVSRVEGMAELRKTVLQDVDFSHAVLSDSVWEYCVWQNVRCCEAEVKNVRFRVCNLTDVDFQNSDLRDCRFADNRGKNASRLERVTFAHSDLRRSAHGIETYHECDFSYANLADVSFEGASFIRCKFAGLMESVSFFLHSRLTITGFFPWLNANPEKISSRFENVDFTKAILMGVDFRGVDLSSCRFPCDEDHLVIYNQNRVFLEARDIIEATWEGEDRRIALSLVTKGHLVHAKKHQPIDVMNKQLEIEILGKDFGEKYFTLLSKINAAMLG